MKVLVTGGTGFTGGALVERLVSTGTATRLLVRDRARWRPRGARVDVDLIQGDICDPAAVAEAMEGVDTVFHLAALYRVAGLPDQAYWDVHVTGTANLLRAAQAAGVRRFVHCSTVGVHGHIDEPPADETYRLSPGDEYQRSKLEGEKLVLRWHAETGLPVTVIRPTPIYGPGDTRLLKLFRLAAMRPRLVLGSGQVYYHMVYVDDLVDSFLLAAESDAAVGEVFIIGGEEFLTLNQLLDRIGKVLSSSGPTLHVPAWPIQLLGSICERICRPFGLEPPIYRRRVDFFTKSRAFCIDKAKRMLRYQPKVMLQEGLGRTVASYRGRGLRVSSLYAFLSTPTVV